MPSFSAAILATLSLFADGALAQPPAIENPPVAQTGVFGPVCLTNSCGGQAVDFTGQTPARSVAEAIALGNAQRVKDLGGTATQAAQALARRAAARAEQAAADPRQSEASAHGAAMFAAFADVSAGGTLTYDTAPVDHLDPLPGRTYTGVVIRRQPDGAHAYLLDDGGALFSGLPPGGLPPGPARTLPDLPQG